MSWNIERKVQENLINALNLEVIDIYSILYTEKPFLVNFSISVPS